MLKKQQEISTTTIVKNFETEVLGILTLMYADSFAKGCGIMDLVVPEQNKSKLKFR